MFNIFIFDFSSIDFLHHLLDFPLVQMKVVGFHKVLINEGESENLTIDQSSGMDVHVQSYFNYLQSFIQL